MDEQQLVVDSAVEPVEQKMLTQEQVNALVGREKREAAEKARRQVEAEYAAKLEEVRAAAGQQNGSQMGGMQQQSVDDIYRQIRERLLQEAQEEQQKAELKQVADTYYSRMSNGSKLFEDFGEVMGDFRPESFPQVVYLASQLDNTPQIMYELAKNPTKLAAIHSLALADPNQAKRALRQLSDSIAHNEQAVNEYEQTNAPLSRPQASHVSSDKGELSLKDLKGMYRN